MADGDRQPPQFPRLAISDFLVLTLCVSFVFALSAYDFQDGFRLYVVRWYDILPDLLDSLVVAFCLFGLIVLARQRFRGTDSQLEPGHSLIGAFGPFKVFSLILGVFQPILMSHWGTERCMAAVDVVCALVFLACVVFPALNFRALPRQWRLCVALVLLVLLLNAAWCVLDAAYNLRFPAGTSRRHLLVTIGNVEASILLATFAAAGIDVYRRVSRDWLHWFGVATLSVSGAATLMHWRILMVRWWRDLLLHLLP